MSEWTRPEQDFRNLTVLEKQGPLGKVVSIQFQQAEWPTSWRRDMWGIVVAVMVGLSFGLVFWAIKIATERSGWEALAYIVIYGAVLLYAMSKVNSVEIVPREVLIDFGANRFQVKRGKKVEISRREKSLQTLTVEDHPDAEYKRQARMEEGSKKLTNEEMSHVLIGWFGTGGAEKVILLDRAEWPDRRSLFEVRQAVLWARERETGEPAKSARGERAAGLNPPLD